MHVSDNLLINNDVLRAIGQGCRSLQLLNLSMSNRAVTDTGLRHLASLSSLNELRLTGHRALTDETLIEIANQGKLKVGENMFFSNSDFVWSILLSCGFYFVRFKYSGFCREFVLLFENVVFLLKNSDFYVVFKF
ncbi:unnamed protein product [Meloidogyne enterolobii]|uniref:Uncharacterized protein n=1 Tax=Meloidogyne enterolobii TaxID=390850 RepID=A0ACB1AT58_MELEN